MSEIDKEQLLADWLENKLDDPQRLIFEQLCQQDEAFSSRVEQVNHLQSLAEVYQDTPVPKWHRESSYTQPLSVTEKPSLWQWSVLPVFSTAMSVLALVFVLTGAQLSWQQGALTLTFTASNRGNDVEQLVNLRLRELQQQQSAALSEFASLINTQQQTNTRNITDFLLTESRDERREDFAELIRFINQQRDDDQRFYARQLNQLKSQLEQQDTGWSKNEYVQD